MSAVLTCTVLQETFSVKYFFCKKHYCITEIMDCISCLGRNYFGKLTGQKGDCFMGVNELREKTLILCVFLQKLYGKLLEFYTLTESNDNHGCI